MSISLFEDFSNEFFYEIFDYLNGCEIYEAFSDLNTRFQQLLDDPSFRYKIHIDYSNGKEKSLNQLK